MPEQAALRPIPQRTLRAGIVQTLREAIQCRRLLPGERLSDSELAPQLGVSRSTVREALHQLTHERLVVSAPHRGFFVAGFDLDDLIDLLEMRGLLEGKIAEAVVLELTAADFAELERLAAAIGARVDPAASSAFWGVDLRFHEVIVRHCAKTVLVELWSALSSRLMLLELLFHDTFESSLGDSQARHRAYIEELRARDPRRARRAAEEHYRYPAERLRRLQPRVKEEDGHG